MAHRRRCSRASLPLRRGHEVVLALVVGQRRDEGVRVDQQHGCGDVAEAETRQQGRPGRSSHAPAPGRRAPATVRPPPAGSTLSRLGLPGTTPVSNTSQIPAICQAAAPPLACPVSALLGDRPAAGCPACGPAGRTSARGSRPRWGRSPWWRCRASTPPRCRRHGDPGPREPAPAETARHPQPRTAHPRPGAGIDVCTPSEWLRGQPDHGPHRQTESAGDRAAADQEGAAALALHESGPVAVTGAGHLRGLESGRIHLRWSRRWPTCPRSR